MRLLKLTVSNMEENKLCEAALKYAKNYCKSIGKTTEQNIQLIYFAFLAGADFYRDNR